MRLSSKLDFFSVQLEDPAFDLLPTSNQFKGIKTVKELSNLVKRYSPTTKQDVQDLLLGDLFEEVKYFFTNTYKQTITLEDVVYNNKFEDVVEDASNYLSIQE
jgi:hypothetical protein